MTYNKLTDKHLAFAMDVVQGMPQERAYVKHFATRPNIKRSTAASNANKIMRASKMKQLVERLKKERVEAVVTEQARVIGKEFSTNILTVDEMDSFHSSVIQGLVMVEEIVQVYYTKDIFDKRGKFVRRDRVPKLERIKRLPNIREKQASVDALYKRGRHLPIGGMFAFGMKTAGEDGEVEKVERFVVLSNGERVKLLGV